MTGHKQKEEGQKMNSINLTKFSFNVFGYL